MTKILITPKNSVWGVIVNPQSSNTYRHALSFDTPALKEAFINKELFNGGDYKALLASQPEISFSRMSATTATFVITPDQYPTETFLSLLNKDFCIIEEDGVEQFYTLSGERDKDGGNSIIFAAELDIFFTYNIKNMFNDKETEIARGMYDRFIKDANGVISPRENYLDTPLINKETFDGDFKDILNPVSEGEDLVYDLTSLPNITIEYSDIPGIGQVLSPEERAYAKKIINNMKWQQLNIVVKSDDTSLPVLTHPKTIVDGSFSHNYTEYVSRKNSFNRIHLPFITILSPAISGASATKFNNSIPNPWDPTTPFKLTLWDVKNADGITNGKPFNSFTQKTIEDPRVLKNSSQLIATSPIPMLKDVKIKFVVAKFQTDGTKPTEVSISMTLDDAGHSEDQNWVVGEAAGYACIVLKSIDEVDYENTYLQKPTPLTDIKLDLSSPKSIDLEPKLYLSPYSLFRVGSSTKNASFIAPEMFTKNEIVAKINNSYLTSNWGYQIDFKNYGNILNLTNPFIPSNRNLIFEDFASYGIPTDQNQWEEFIMRNRSSQNASFLNKGLGAGLGVLGAIAAPFTGGASLALAGAGLASVAAKSASDINSQMAQRKDIKNSPNTIQNNGSTFGFDLTNKSMTPYFQRYSLDPVLKSQIFDHIYKYGYNFDSRIKNINNFLDTRYWFNYIEASKTLENIHLQVSPEIKQLINDTMNSGLTIWHVRDLSTFKGIKSYENENVEMSLLTTQADEEVTNDNRKEK